MYTTNVSLPFKFCHLHCDAACKPFYCEDFLPMYSRCVKRTFLINMQVDQQVNCVMGSHKRKANFVPTLWLHMIGMGLSSSSHLNLILM